MTLVISLLFIGILLLLVELLFVPGFGVPGFLGLICLIASCYIGYTDFGVSTGNFILLSEIIILSVCLWFVFREKTWKKLRLNEKISSRVDTSAEEKGLSQGMKGIAISRINPIGKARFGEMSVEVVSQRDSIDSGKEIIILEIVENKIIVTECC